jgi:hypothetical protein
VNNDKMEYRKGDIFKIIKKHNASYLK